MFVYILENTHGKRIIRTLGHPAFTRGSTDERERVLAAGMNDHVVKPINVALLYRTLARWVRPAD